MGFRFLRLQIFLCMVVFTCSCAAPEASVSPPPLPIAVTGLPPASATSIPPTPSPTAVLPASSPTSEFPLADSVEDILGTWRGLGPHPLFYQFNPDGSNLVARTADRLPDHPDAIQQVTFEGTNLIMVEVKVIDLRTCGEKVGIYQVLLVEEGLIKFVTIEDPCSHRRSSTEGLHKLVE